MRKRPHFAILAPLALALGACQPVAHAAEAVYDAPLAARTADEGEGLKAVLARIGGAEDFDALEERLRALKAEAEAIVDRLLPAPVGESGAKGVGEA